jgi:hypothetical protein
MTCVTCSAADRAYRVGTDQGEEEFHEQLDNPYRRRPSAALTGASAAAVVLGASGEGR